MKRNRLIIWIPLLIAATINAGLYFGSGINKTQNSSGNNKFNSILSLINNEYVDHVNMDSLIEETKPELLSHLDPHSTYIPAKALNAVNDELDGTFSGIGISFMLKNDTISIIEVLSGGPSEKVGLMPGDRIVSVDDSIVAGKNFTNEKVLSILRGEKGSQVKLGIKRNTAKETLHFDLIRDDIPVTSVDAA